MEFNYFDIVASVIIVLLGLKGIINGFFKELFGLIGIIGGLFVASRFGDMVGKYLSDMVFKLQSDAAISFTGFLVTLAVFWLVMIFIGFVFKKMSSMSGLGPIDRFFGFVLGAGKFFLIAAVIAFAVHNTKSLQKSVDSLMATSKLYPILVETGGVIMKIDPTEMSKQVSASVEQTTQQVQEQVAQQVQESAQEQIEKIKKELKPQTTPDTEHETEPTQEH